jgi:hypothetical protein
VAAIRTARTAKRNLPRGVGRAGRTRSREKAPARLPLFRRLGKAVSKLASRLVKAVASPPALSATSRQQIEALIVQMKAEPQSLTAMMAESWLVVESMTRNLPRTSIPAEILAQLAREGSENERSG